MYFFRFGSISAVLGAFYISRAFFKICVLFEYVETWQMPFSTFFSKTMFDHGYIPNV